jgi:VanZ family protein
MDQQTSEQESGRVLKALYSILCGLGIRTDMDVLHTVVRKIAHFVEFAALGVCVGGYALNRGYLHERIYLAMPLRLTLMVAVCDEFIQKFSGRASMVADVVLDYAGAILGLLLVAGSVFCKNKIARRKRS